MKARFAYRLVLSDGLREGIRPYEVKGSPHLEETTTMEDKQIVWKKYPNADCVRGRKLFYVYSEMPPFPYSRTSIELGGGVTAELAWNHAAFTVVAGRP